MDLRYENADCIFEFPNLLCQFCNLRAVTIIIVVVFFHSSMWAVPSRLYLLQPELSGFVLTLSPGCKIDKYRLSLRPQIMSTSPLSLCELRHRILFHTLTPHPHRSQPENHHRIRGCRLVLLLCSLIKASNPGIRAIYILLSQPFTFILFSNEVIPLQLFVLAYVWYHVVSMWQM